MINNEYGINTQKSTVFLYTCNKYKIQFKKRSKYQENEKTSHRLKDIYKRLN